MERAKIGVHNLVQRVGFFGILACASVSFEKHYNLFISTLININPHKTFNTHKTKSNIKRKFEEKLCSLVASSCRNVTVKNWNNMLLNHCSAFILPNSIFL